MAWTAVLVPVRVAGVAVAVLYNGVDVTWAGVRQTMLSRRLGSGSGLQSTEGRPRTFPKVELGGQFEWLAGAAPGALGAGQAELAFALLASIKS